MTDKESSEVQTIARGIERGAGRLGGRLVYNIIGLAMVAILGCVLLACVLTLGGAFI